MSTELIKVIPVLESADIDRDVKWYKEKTGFEVSFLHEKMYAGLYRDDLEIHLQWHAGTKGDPMNGGAVIRICVKNIKPFLKNSNKGAQSKKKISRKTHHGELMSLLFMI
jgi:hypothetical protein